MAENPLHDELRQLAEEVANGPPAVADLGADIARQYTECRFIVRGILEVDAMVAGQGEVPENHPRLVRLREDLRDRLRNLLAWARETGRM